MWTSSRNRACSTVAAEDVVLGLRATRRQSSARWKSARRVCMLQIALSLGLVGGLHGQLWFPTIDWAQEDLVLGSEDGDQFGAALVAADFNGDGRDDLAVGLPTEDISFEEEGAVVVMFGAEGGLTATGRLFLRQQDCSANGAFDHFGEVLAAGDFDEDGNDDLAVGMPGRNVTVSIGDTRLDTGAVCVFYGPGLGSGSAQFFSLDTAGVSTVADSNDNFGAALAAGDFDRDGYEDLAVGAPRNEAEPPLSSLDRGTVTVLRGSSSGLVTTGSRFYYAGALGGFLRDGIGGALASGNFSSHDDDRSELVIGQPESTLYASESGGPASDAANAGTVLWIGDFYSKAPNPDFYPTRLFRRTTEPRANAFLGSNLAAGDVDCNGIDDVVVGVPDDDISGTKGRVYVWYGVEAAPGVPASGGPIYNSISYFDLRDLAGGASGETHFGAALAVADFDLDGCDDIAVGAGGFDNGAIDDGLVLIIPGGPSGFDDDAFAFSPNGHLFEGGDRHGMALAAGRFPGGAHQLAIGAPGWAPAGVSEAGLVRIVSNRGIFGDSFESGDVTAWSSATP